MLRKLIIKRVAGRQQCEKAGEERHADAFRAARARANIVYSGEAALAEAVARRDALRALCAAHNVGTEIYYPVPLHAQECFRYCGCQPGDMPVAMQLAGEALSVPIYPELGRAQQDEVIAVIREFLAV